MSEAKHTPGPWKEGDYIIWPANYGDAQFPIHARKRGRIALALTKQADARLIAAAPELLEALAYAVKCIAVSNEFQLGNPAYEQAEAMGKAALAKAQGQKKE